MSLLKPKNFKLLLLASINAIGKEWWQGVKVLLGGLCGYFFAVFFLETYVKNKASFDKADILLKYGIWFIAVTYAWCLGVHSSVGRKNKAYLFSKKYVLLWVIYYILCLAYVLVTAYVYGMGFDTIFYCSDAAYRTSVLYEVPSFVMFSGLLVLSILWLLLMIFFNLDSDGSFKSMLVSMVRAAKMLIYNMPGFLVIGGILYTGTMLVGSMLSTIFCSVNGSSVSSIGISPLAQSMIATAVVLVIMGSTIIPLWVSLINNVYIKQLYDHKDRYI